MEEQLVSLEVAKLLKEKEFNISCRYCYGYHTESICDFMIERRGTIYEDEYDGYNWNDGKFPLIEHPTSAPTQSLAQKWLREEKGIVLIVDVDFTELKCYYCNIYDHSRLLAKQSDNYITYEEALEEGLKEALKLI